MPDSPNVIYISVDGLRSGDATANLQMLIDAGLAPAFARLQAEGASTFGARTDPLWTITIPNHATMVTGRPVEDVSGAEGHGYRWNSDAEDIPDTPIPGVNVSTLHTSAGEYVPSIFNVAHDNGLTTALYATKTKFSLFDESYDGIDQAGDPVFENDPLARDTIGEDNGADKIDRYFQNGSSEVMVDRIIADAATEGLANLTFVHIDDPDSAGHDTGWGSPEYLAAIQTADEQIGRILAMIDADPDLAGNTYIVVTADHGGGGDIVIDDNHALPLAPLNFTIPFFVLGPDVAAGADLYDLNDKRAQPDAALNPSLLITNLTGSQPPVRNGDGGNLLLDLLGLEPVPTSAINGKQDLNIFDVDFTYGTDAHESIGGTAAGDGIHGGGGDDLLFGEAGDDVLKGWLGDDILNGGAGNDRLNGSAGIDRVTYHTAAAGVVVDLDITRAQNTRGSGRDALIAIESLTGSDFDDRLAGHAGANVIDGRAGNDLLIGRDGADTLVGAELDDRLLGGAGADGLSGGHDDDYLDGGAGADVMDGGRGDDLFIVDHRGDGVIEAVDEGIDTVRSAVDFALGDHLERLFLTGHARVGTGNALDNAIQGRTGADSLSGLAGNDVIRGNNGIDILDGGAGNDILYGGALRDTLTGGTGADQFRFLEGDLVALIAQADRITDFSTAEGDRIFLNLIDADVTRGDDQAFAFVGSAAFSGRAGELRVVANGADLLVTGDTDGDGAGDLFLRLSGITGVTAADFVL